MIDYTIKDLEETYSEEKKIIKNNLENRLETHTNELKKALKVYEFFKKCLNEQVKLVWKMKHDLADTNLQFGSSSIDKDFVTYKPDNNNLATYLKSEEPLYVEFKKSLGKWKILKVRFQLPDSSYMSEHVLTNISGTDKQKMKQINEDVPIIAAVYRNLYNDAITKLGCPGIEFDAKTLLDILGIAKN